MGEIILEYLLHEDKLYIYIYIWRNVEMVDFGESDKMIKINGKVDQPNTYNGFSSNISFFIQGRTSFKNNFFRE